MYGIKVPFEKTFLWVIDSVTGKILRFESASEAAMHGLIWKQYTVARIPEDLLDWTDKDK